ncbi:unnamed protein product [Clonostachys chloroleuca]|uniref:Uncharacterized protein n=1 Tax=Clonostachys chloroleuca TaxID=1926264 RepID=A0AA35Q7T2_9HYPO|nr:unnamed protein product [Clonostachys chloroleuca]
MSDTKKTVLVTGGNAGLGYEVVKALYKSNTAYNLIIASRSLAKAQGAIETLIQETPDSLSTLDVVQLDISQDDSIESCIELVSTKYGKLDILINNAGAAFDYEIAAGRMSLREGFNNSWDINVTGTHVLTHLAMPLLFKSDERRLLFVTSGAASLAETEMSGSAMFDRNNASPDAGWPKTSQRNITAYKSSKTGLNMLMREWERILRNDDFKIWCISPGFLATGLGGAGPEALKKSGALDPSVGGQFIKDVVEGRRDRDIGKVIRVDMIQPW